MKKVLTILLACMLIISSQLKAQKILLKIASITDPAGEDVRAVDYRVDAQVTYSGGGIFVSPAQVHDILIKKTRNTSTNGLYKKILQGLTIPVVILEYYDTANVLFFRITLKTVYVTNFYFLSPECPTCLKLEHQVAFAPKQIETFDVATGITIGYDVTTKLTY